MTSSRRGNNDGIVIQDRDRHLLSEIAVMRVVDREQARIAGGFNSTTRVNTRLLALTRAGLLRRFFLGATGSGKKALYALSKRGAAQVGMRPLGPRRRNDETLVADYFVSHQLSINEVYCALKHAPSPDGFTFERWITFSEPLAKNLRLIPDGYFELKAPTGTMAAFLEVDLGHERLAVWKEKTKRYLEFAVSGDYQSRLGQTQFRVLVVANAERRLQSIRQVVRASTQKIFWFATLGDIQSNGLFAPIWRRTDGDEMQPLLAYIQSPL